MPEAQVTGITVTLWLSDAQFSQDGNRWFLTFHPRNLTTTIQNFEDVLTHLKAIRSAIEVTDG